VGGNDPEATTHRGRCTSADPAGRHDELGDVDVVNELRAREGGIDDAAGGVLAPTMAGQVRR